MSVRRIEYWLGMNWLDLLGARCCIATFSPDSPVGGTGRKIASGKYRKPYADREQRARSGCILLPTKNRGNGWG